MLQQILESMYIDPELLAHLSEEDRNVLLHKMRVEQVRRWKEWENQVEEEEKARKKPKLPPKPGSKRVKFLLGNDGNPWTWVIDDDTEADDNNIQTKNDYISAAKRLDGLTISSPSTKRKDLKPVNSQEKSRLLDGDAEEAEDREVQAVLTRAKRLAQVWEQREAKERAEFMRRKQEKKPLISTRAENKEHSDGTAAPEVKQAYAQLRNTQKNANELQDSIRKSVENGESNNVENGERKADRETVKQIRDIARKAKEDLEVMSQTQTELITNNNQRNLSTNTSRSGTLQITRTRNRPGKPPSKEAIVEWFRNEEKPRDAGLDPVTNTVAPWFHGLINRHESEELLKYARTGTFLVRFCERIWGYAVSYRSEDKCKHYLIDASNGHYQFLGEGSMKFCKLSDLIRYYQVQPITGSSHDCLVRPCPNANTEDIYNTLFS
ncbi:hypothetical protein CHUAL_011600 [Chamberlinius hualienensis]